MTPFILKKKKMPKCVYKCPEKGLGNFTLELFLGRGVGLLGKGEDAYLHCMFLILFL